MLLNRLCAYHNGSLNEKKSEMKRSSCQRDFANILSSGAWVKNCNRLSRNFVKEVAENGVCWDLEVFSVSKRQKDGVKPESRNDSLPGFCNVVHNLLFFSPWLQINWAHYPNRIRPVSLDTKNLNGFDYHRIIDNREIYRFIWYVWLNLVHIRSMGSSKFTLNSACLRGFFPRYFSYNPTRQ